MSDDAANDRSQRQQLDTSRADRRRSLGALHDAEASAGTAAPGREAEWVSTLGLTLGELQSALEAQIGNVAADQGLYASLERDVPRLSSRVRRIRDGYRELLDQLADLRGEVERVTDASAADVANLRSRLALVAAQLRNVRSEEADLLYEAYMVDIGGGD